jgi:hypothetical protein
MEPEIIASLVEAVAALNRRVNDLGSFELIAGPQGPAGENGEPGPPPTDEAIRDAATAWLSANITQPADGQPGAEGPQGPQGDIGPQGPQGRPPTEQEIELAVSIWMEANRAGLRGTDGRRGDDGADGRDGVDGRPGPAGPVGATGSQGIGIALVEQRDEGSFWITLDDGREFEIELPKAATQIITGGGGKDLPAYLSAYSSTTQTEVPNVAAPMRFENVVEGVRITITDDVKVTFSQPGIYNIQFSAQLVNTQSQEHDVSIWLMRNGTAEPNSCTDITVPARHGSVDGAAVAAWNLFYRVSAGEYFRLMWSASSANVTLGAIPARIDPVRPATPSIILTVNRVAP